MIAPPLRKALFSLFLRWECYERIIQVESLFNSETTFSALSGIVEVRMFIRSAYGVIGSNDWIVAHQAVTTRKSFILARERPLVAQSESSVEKSVRALADRRWPLYTADFS